MVEVRQVDERLSHDLVLHEHVVVLEGLADNVPVLILHDQHLLGLRHARDHQQTKLRHRSRVEHAPVAARSARGGIRREGKLSHPAARRAVAVALVQVTHQHVPVVQAHFENLRLVRVRDVEEVFKPDE